MEQITYVLLIMGVLTVIIKNTGMHYGFVSKFLHWLIALCVFFMLVLGFFLNTLSHGPHADFFYDLHKEIGITVLFLMFLRLLWRMMNQKPQLPSNLSGWEVLFSTWSHNLFYFLLILMPIDGWVMSVASGYAPSYFGFFTLNLPIQQNKTLTNFTAQTHAFLAWTLLVLISIHILAALKHYFYNKDTILQRMMLPNK